MTDDFSDSLSFLNEPEPIKPAKKRVPKPEHDDFQTGLEAVSYKEAAKATGSSMAGQYKRYTAYLSPETIAHFKLISKEVGLSQAETARWFFQHMFDLYEQGIRPETEEITVRRRLRR